GGGGGGWEWAGGRPGRPRRSGAAAHPGEGDVPLADWEESSTVRVIPPARPRRLAKVPFVELADGRLQGVVSSGSDIERVYVSSVEAGSYAVACSKNRRESWRGAREMREARC